MAPTRSASLPARRRDFGRLVTSYSLAAGGALGLAADASATPIMANVSRTTLSQDGDRIVVDLDGDQLGDVVIRAHNYIDGILFDIISHVYETSGVQRNLIAHGYDSGGDLGVTMFGAGDRIGPDTRDWQGRFADPSDPSIGVLFESATGSGPFLNHHGFVGLFFDIPGGSHHFGYLEIDGGSNALTILGGAYESQANAPIQVPVPEPGSLSLLACGAAGLAAWRRARRRHDA